MRGTPTTIIIDRAGRIVEHAFGQVDDLALGVLLGTLAAEAPRSDGNLILRCGMLRRRLPSPGPRLTWRHFVLDEP
jgi:hypothetical protein